ncbi:MAG: cobyrinic acid a,c-diamide synthase [Frankiaceae bacterium]|nr:cobyrinic acid a,c-diamide synthase [Frankiaceae bacterium]
MVALPPRVVLAAPSSGSGKTTVTTGILAALRSRGTTAAAFKVGPDFIDPTYHSLACGRPGRNLDAYLCGPELMAPLLAHGSAGAQVAVIEGVMGLYDGKGGTDEASTAHVARLLHAPVVLVVDARSMSRSVAALVHGFSSYDPSLVIAGVILNQVGSDSHELMLRESLAPLGIPVLGALRRRDDLTAPSRHLGLVPAAERAAESARQVAVWASLVRDAIDLDELLRIAAAAPTLEAEPWSAAVVGPAHVGSRVGVLTGGAFGFVYAEHLELLRAAGAEVVEVHQDDETLPAIGALYVPGGFPEVYAAELSANAALRASVRAFASGGGAVVGECGGLLWLGSELDGLPMCGVVPGAARMTSRLTLGYRLASAAHDSWYAGSAGDSVRAHEFHYSTMTPPAGQRAAWQIGDRPEGYTTARVHASYLHTHWAGAPALAGNLARAGVSRCR